MLQPLPNITFRIRQSLLEQAACLFRFKKHTLDGLPSPDTEPTMRGTEFHDMTKQYIDHLVKRGFDTDYDAADRISSRYHGEAKRLFDRWTREREFEPKTIFETEFTITLRWDHTPISVDTPPEEAPWGGTLDRVELDLDNGEADIWDYKTSWAIFSPDTIQARYYPWLLSKVFVKLKKIRFHLDFVRYNVIKTQEFTKEDLVVVEREIEELVKRLDLAIETKQWPAITNAYCANCVLECPLVQGGLSRKLVGQIDAETADAMAAELYTMTAQANRMKTVLKNYAAENGPIAVGAHHVLGFKKTRKVRYAAREIAELNKKHGFDEVRALQSDSKEVKKISRDYPEYLRTLNKSKKTKDNSTSEFVFMSSEPELEFDGEAPEDW